MFRRNMSVMRKWHDYLNSVQYDEKGSRPGKQTHTVYCVLNVFNIQLCKKNSRKIVLSFYTS